MKAAAWAGRALQSDPKTLTARAVDAGLSAVALVANDASAQHSGPARWAPYDWAAVIDCAETLRAAGIEPHVMVWLVADSGYIAAMTADLARYAPHFGAVHLDVEEPWVRRTANHERLGADVAEAMKAVGLPVYVTAIAHTAFDRVGVLTPLAPVWVPQVYCTLEAARKWKVDPATSPARGVRRYREHFPVGAIECGLAAYDTTPEALTAAWDSAAEAGCERVWYWALHAMSAGTRGRIRALASGT